MQAMNSEKDWVSVFTTGQIHLAALAEQSLKKEGIPVVKMDKKDSSYLFGSIDVMVEKKHLDKATNLIDQFKKDLEIE
ncbi:MAG: putative signal transducing protein [Bacteroidota bacterium]